MGRLALACLLMLGVAAPAIIAQDTPAPADHEVRMVKLPLELPAVGNIEGVKEWRFGRLESVEQQGDHPDIILTIRLLDGSTHRIIGPARPLSELARRSNWVSAEDHARPGRADYAERQIAFDADANMRLIAMMSLEPVPRNRSKLGRAVGP